MIDKYLLSTPQERIELLDAVSKERGLAPSILEKDYWVCKTLDVLFSLPGLGEHLVFKGGTSLSKVYGLIDRFSEDVDVSFHREFLGFGEEHDPEAASGKEQARRIEALQQACKDCIRGTLLPALQSEMSNRLGGEDGWDTRFPVVSWHGYFSVFWQFTATATAATATPDQAWRCGVRGWLRFLKQLPNQLPKMHH